MIIALLALAFAMIVGGLLAAFLGWDIVLVERGWTMVIAGSISAASGALLLGITAAVSKLARIQAQLAHLAGGSDVDAAFASRASPDLSAAALSGGLLGGALGEAGAREQDEELAKFPPRADADKREQDVAEEPSGRFVSAKPADSVPPRPERSFEDASSPAEEAPDVKVPDFLLAKRLRETYQESRNSEVDESLYDSEPDVPEERRSEETARDEVVEPVAEPEPEAPAEPVEPDTMPEEPRIPTIVGTYNSGDNRYVMYSDGSIKAETPGGVFHFHSLDELKEFIASGGEGGSSAA